MTVHLDAEELASASVELRPYCLERSACAAKTPGKHCVRCTAASPDTRARKSAGIRKLYEENPTKLAEKIAHARALSADPEVIARRSATMIETHKRPDVHARHVAGCRAATARRMQDPVELEKLRELGRKVCQFNMEHMTPEVMARRASALRAYWLSWCPPEQWAFNRILKRKGFNLAERKQIILSEDPVAESGAEIVRRNTEAMLQKHARDLASRY